MDSLDDDSVVDLLVQHDSNGVWVDVPDSSDLSVEVLVWETVLDAGVAEDCDIVTNLVWVEDCCCVCETVLSVWSLE